MTPLRQTRFGENGNCWQAAVACIVEVPVDHCIDVLDGRMPERLWFDRTWLWCKAMGWEMKFTKRKPKGFAIAVGETERSGVFHAIIVKDGEPHWDPHPSDLFITMPPRHYVSFRKVHYEAA